jgi:RNA polymerase sigma-70 factor (ECF subfamily)
MNVSPRLRARRRPGACPLPHANENRQPVQIEDLPPIMDLTRGGAAISELDDIDALVRVYRPKLLRYVTFTLNDADLAETITQDCFLKAYRTRGSFRGDCSINTWLFSIANNLIRDQLRVEKFLFWRRVRASAIDLTDIASLEPSSDPSPEKQVLVRERANQVQRALADLSAKQRQVFILRFLEDLTLEEISTSTGMPINTAKTHLHRALKAVRKQLGGNQ